MHPLSVAARRDNPGDKRAVTMCVIYAGAGEITRLKDTCRQIGVIGIDTRIGNGHQATKPGPAARVGAAETGGANGAAAA